MKNETIERRTLQMTAGFWARAAATILSDPKTTGEDRERIIGEIRQLAQYAADQGAAPFVKTEDLPEGRR